MSANQHEIHKLRNEIKNSYVNQLKSHFDAATQTVTKANLLFTNPTLKIETVNSAVHDQKEASAYISAALTKLTEMYLHLGTLTTLQTRIGEWHTAATVAHTDAAFNGSLNMANARNIHTTVMNSVTAAGNCMSTNKFPAGSSITLANGTAFVPHQSLSIPLAFNALNERYQAMQEDLKAAQQAAVTARQEAKARAERAAQEEIAKRMENAAKEAKLAAEHAAKQAEVAAKTVQNAFGNSPEGQLNQSDKGDNKRRAEEHASSSPSNEGHKSFSPDDMDLITTLVKDAAIASATLAESSNGLSKIFEGKDLEDLGAKTSQRLVVESKEFATAIAPEVAKLQLALARLAGKIGLELPALEASTSDDSLSAASNSPASSKGVQFSNAGNNAAAARIANSPVQSANASNSASLSNSSPAVK